MSEKFSAEERAAMRARAKELKESQDGDKAIQEAFKKMTPADRALAKKVDGLVRQAAPGLMPKTWYGMPAYANSDGKVVCFFKNAGKFKARYSELGFNEAANLDSGGMWPTVFAVTKLTAADEAKISKLVKQAVR
jgi:uncharacterized protein YdhG (YjbR/CyaY superfamily)